jgi:hypothetical protein
MEGQFQFTSTTASTTSRLQDYLKTHRQNALTFDLENLDVFFRRDNRRVLQHMIYDKILKEMNVQIPEQPDAELVEFMIEAIDYFPTGTFLDWNVLTTKFAAKNIRKNLLLDRRWKQRFEQRTRNMPISNDDRCHPRNFELCSQRWRTGSNAIPLPRPLPLDTSIRGDKTPDLTNQIIARGMSGRPRVSRRHGLVNFLRDSAENHYWKNRSVESQTRL